MLRKLGSAVGLLEPAVDISMTEVGATPAALSVMHDEVVDGHEIRAKPSSPLKLKKQLSEYFAKEEADQAGFIEIKSKYYPAYAASLPSCEGKVFAITGCTSGTGYILAKTLVDKKATVVMLNRPSGRHELALSKLEALAVSCGAPAPVAIPCDLASFAKTRAAGEELHRRYGESGLDGLCCNAGIMGFTDDATEDGLDIQMQSNHTGHFLLSKYAMPALEAAARLRGDARVVNHSSALRALPDTKWNNVLKEEYLAKNGGNLGGSKPGMLKGPNYERYQQSKLANVVFTYAMHDKLQAKGSNVKALVAHPGVAPTALHLNSMVGGETPPIPLPSCVFKWVMKTLLMHSEEDGTMGLLKCLCDPNASSGEFYGPVGNGYHGGKHDQRSYRGPAERLPEESLADAKSRELLWEVSESVIGERFVI